jgi:hypothetical protein
MNFSLSVIANARQKIHIKDIGHIKMDLSNSQLAVLEKLTEIAPRVIARNYTSDCCIAATRITIEVLKKFHFKDVKPLVVEANVFNETYLKKGRTPKDNEEAQAWLAEGAWQVVVGDKTVNTEGTKGWAGHLVAVVNGKYMVDLAITQATRPHKNIHLSPIASVVPEEFVTNPDRCGLMFNNCLVVYVSYPKDVSYQRARDWWDKKRSDEFVKEIAGDIKYALKENK